MLLINKTLLKLAKGLWGWIIAIAAVRFIALISMTYFAEIIAGYSTDLFSPVMSDEMLKSALLSALITALIMLASQLIQGELEYRCTRSARKMLRSRIFAKVLELDAGNIETIGPVSAITSSVDAVENMQVYYSTYLPSLLFSIIAPVYLFFRLSKSSLLIAFILFAVSLILLPLNNLFRYRIEKLRRVYWSSLEDMTAYYLDSIRGLTTIKLFEKTEERTKVLNDKAEKLNHDINSFMRVNFTSFLATEGLIYAAIILSVILSVSYLHAGNMTLNEAMRILMLSYSFFSSIRTLMNATHSALTAVAAAGKVEDILKINTERPYDPSLPVYETAEKGIELKNVSFHYEGRKETLHDVSLFIPKGKMTALAGMSGCGKSTVASLMMRFMDIDQGQILLEGKDYLSMKPEEIRKHIVMVPQSVSIFSGTIRDNLLIANRDADDEKLYKALEDAALASFVRSLPEGLDSDVGEGGSKLSGGQKQKIGIARALLSEAEYMIFDEATSSVDPESEAEIQSCIRRLSETKTLIIISHRLSAIRNADVIYVLESGEVSENGSHDDLMKQNGLYAKLVTEQNRLEGGLS